MKRFACILLSLITLLSMFSVVPVSAAVEGDGTQDPAPAKETYDINGITYYNTHSTSFDKDKEKYYVDLFDTKSSALSDDSYGDRSMSQLWLRFALGLSPYGSCVVGKGDTFTKTEDALLNCEDTSGKYGDGSGFTSCYGVDNNNSATTKYYSSLHDAENDVFKVLANNVKPYDNKNAYNYDVNDLQSKYGSLNSDTDKKDAVMTIVYTKPSGGPYKKGDHVGSEAWAVIFTDFDVIPIVPADEGNTYLQTTIVDKPAADNQIIASEQVNNTAQDGTASIKVSEGYSSSATATVSGSSTYTSSEALKAGGGIQFGIFKADAEATYTTTQAIEKGWSNAHTETSDKSVEHNQEITLPAHFVALLKSSESITTRQTRYNCPVAIRYTVYLMDYSATYCYDNPRDKFEGAYCKFTFGNDSGNAVTDLKQRHDAGGIDSEWIHWSNFDKSTGIGSVDAYNTILNHVPMAPTSATFTETLDTTKLEADGALPIYPLAFIKVSAPKDMFITGDEISYDKYNYLVSNMQVGDSSQTDYLNLEGYDNQDVPYCTFSSAYGHWIVADKDGNAWTGNDAPIVLEKTPAGTKYTAVRPGTCYLKYVIDEDRYNYYNHLDGFITNADLQSTAAVEVNVTQKPGSVAVTGNYISILRQDKLERIGGLNVTVYDNSGKEVDAPYTWEAQELPRRGITVTPDGMVTFIQRGTYHVRAVCEGVNAESDWIEIKAI